MGPGGRSRHHRLANRSRVVTERTLAIDGLGAHKAHQCLVPGPTEESLACPKHDREDLQPQLVNEVVLHQRVHELEAGQDDYLPLQFPLQPQDLLRHVAALQYRRVVPVGDFEGRGDDILGWLLIPSANSPLRDGHRAANHP